MSMLRGKYKLKIGYLLKNSRKHSKIGRKMNNNRRSLSSIEEELEKSEEELERSSFSAKPSFSTAHSVKLKVKISLSTYNINRSIRTDPPKLCSNLSGSFSPNNQSSISQEFLSQLFSDNAVFRKETSVHFVGFSWSDEELA